ncbi:MAG TPA: hypothetical protein VMF89_24040 [Polyangiales bacterium]|nr:hypothetical protein [Polyangiales bacterium]
MRWRLNRLRAATELARTTALFSGQFARITDPRMEGDIGRLAA